MSVKKREKAKLRKEANKKKVFAKLRNYPTSPRKMRLMADMIRGIKIAEALDVLKYSSKHASLPMEKLLKSAISNWEQKNEGKRVEDNDIYVQEVFVDSARVLKRIRPAPQGRAHRIRKRSNHITIYLGSLNEKHLEKQPIDKDIRVEKVEKENDNN